MRRWETRPLESWSWTLSLSHTLTLSYTHTLTLSHSPAQVRDKATGELVQNLTSAAPRFLVSRTHIDVSDQIIDMCDKNIKLCDQIINAC